MHRADGRVARAYVYRSRVTDVPFRVLVVGGAGVFGTRLVDAALASTDWQIVVAGRDAARLRAFGAARGERVSTVALDATRCSAADLVATGAHAVVDMAGPFRGRVITWP